MAEEKKKIEAEKTSASEIGTDRKDETGIADGDDGTLDLTGNAEEGSRADRSVRSSKNPGAQPKENIERLKRIRKKRENGVSMRALAIAGAAVAAVTVSAVAAGVVSGHAGGSDGSIRVETAAASLETTTPPETTASDEPMSIVLETTLSEEELASIAQAERVQSVLDGYANLGIAAVSGYLNVRKTPESFGEVIGRLQSGGACEIVDTSTDGWYKISSGGVTGYVSSQYVYTGEKAKEAAAENVKERAVITADKLNIRSEASETAEIVGQALKGERYLVREISGDWIRIEDGYISAAYADVRYALNEARKQDMRTTVLNLYDNLGVSNVTNYLNVREKPSESGKIIAKLPSNAGCDVLETTDDGWYKIRSGKITGYVKAEFILTGQEAKDKAMQVAKLMAFTTTDGVNVRKEPNTSSSIWTQLAKNEHYIVADQQDGWVEIELDDTTAYISSDLVEVRYGLDEAIPYTPVVETKSTAGTGKNNGKTNGGTSTKPSAGSQSGSKTNDGAAGSNAGSVSSKRAQIANYAVQFVGNPYVWGGTSLTNGADCSGFTMSVMAHFGVSLPHSSSAQSGCGKSITSSQMRPGDLVFYAGSGGGINHVAIYIGNGQVCHASSAKTGIKISTWNYRSPAKIVNVLGD